MKRIVSNIQKTLAFLLVPFVVAVTAIDAGAETPSTPAGFYRLDCLGNSDTIVSIPFSRPETVFSQVQSIAGSELTVVGTPGWLTNQFVYASGTQSNTYYLRFLSSAKEGSYYPIVENGTNSLTLSLGGDDLSSVTNGTRLAVIPYWTLGTAFLGGKGVIASANGVTRKTEVLIPDVNGVGINLSPVATYYFVTNATFPNGIWQKVGAGTTNKNDDVLLPDNYFIVRHNTASNTVFTAQGSVPVSKLTVVLSTDTAVKQDNFAALTRPVTNTLDESGLFQSGAFLASPSALSRTDELLVFDNNQVAKNKAAAATYYYLSTWRRVGSGTTNMGSQPVFTSGTGFIIRKQTNGVSSLWINSPNYDYPSLIDAPVLVSISESPEGSGNFTSVWQVVVGRIYRFHWRTNLLAGAWENLLIEGQEDYTADAANVSINHAAGVDAPCGFFRAVDVTDDSDGDNLPDSWEIQHFGNLNQTASGDPDGDGLTNMQEYQLGTDPTNTDTDNDGVSDYLEHLQGRNPLVAGTVADTNNSTKLQVYTPLK